MSEDEESAKASRFEQEIREELDVRPAQKFADELDWLTGDASTRVKLSLFLHPKTLYPFSVDVSRGLWVARSRALVVAELDRALRDPTQPISINSSFLSTAASLKAHEESPYNPENVEAPLRW